MCVDTIADENSSQTANHKNEMNNMETTHQETDFSQENELSLPSITANGNYPVATNNDEVREKMEEILETTNSVKEKPD